MSDESDSSYSSSNRSNTSSISQVLRKINANSISDDIHVALTSLKTCWDEIKDILEEENDNEDDSLTRALFFRDNLNGNLPMHDLMDIYLDVKTALDQSDLQRRHHMLQVTLHGLKEFLQLFVNEKLNNPHDSLQMDVEVKENWIDVGGLFELNKEKIDFVTYRRRTPIQILLTKYELILNYCTKYTSDSIYDQEKELGVVNVETKEERKTFTKELIEERKAVEKILITANTCIQICINAATRLWKRKGCKDPFTIMNVAVEVFPLLKVETLQYILHNFDQVTNDENKKDYPMHYKDLQGQTVLMKAIRQATSRKQIWGDWKPRFHAILYDNNNDEHVENRKRSDQCWIRDKDGRLPIHVAIEKGLDWNNGLKELVETDYVTLLEQDPMNGLQPFAHVASKKASPSQLNLIMDLILANPTVIQTVPFTRR